MRKLSAKEWAAAVPPGMRALPQWVGWRLGEPDKNGRRAKQPYELKTGQLARTNDPATFSTFAAALVFYQEHEAEPDVGCGFVFTRGDGLLFVDVDHCLHEDEQEGDRVKDWARELVVSLRGQTYCERSPSGTGLHFFGVGILPRAEGVSGGRVQVGDGAVEVYAERRFSTVTGIRGNKLGLGPLTPATLPPALLTKLAPHTSPPTAGDATPGSEAGAREPLARREEVWEAMKSLDPDLPHDEWVRVGMALKAAFGEGGLPLWVKWSSGGKKWKRGEPEQRWHSFKRAGVGLGSLFRLARQAGWNAEQGPQEAFAEYRREGFWTVPLSGVEDEELSWLVRDLGLARGYASLLAGDGGRGKSSLTLDVAARLSRGLPMPWEKDVGREPQRILYLNAEDGAGDTIKPRARAAGADLSRIEVLDLAGGSQVPQLPDDVEALERLVEGLGDAQLVVIDPLNAFLGRDVDAHKAHDIRQALQPLANMLKRTGRTVEFVAHLNKNEAVSALYRVSGSADQVMFVRTAMLVGADPEDEEGDRRVVAPLKWNLGRPPTARTFRVVDCGRDIGRIEWGGEAEATADDLTRRPEAGTGRAVGEAEAWLRSRLAAGPAPVRLVQEEARAAGLSRATLYRAAHRLGLRGEQDGISGGRRWPQMKGYQEEPKP